VVLLLISSVYNFYLVDIMMFSVDAKHKINAKCVHAFRVKIISNHSLVCQKLCHGCFIF